MNHDEQHETFRHMIDEGLAGGLSADREHSLREHLDSCVPCQEYLSASNRVIAGLRGFSFHVDAALNARVLTALSGNTRKTGTPRPPVATGSSSFWRHGLVRFALGQGAQPSRRRWLLSSAAAVVLTISCSLVELRFGDLIAAAFDMQRLQLRQELLAFWIVPSLCVLLLFPLLPLLSKAGARREERAQ
jgi:hypothetical protein